MNLYACLINCARGRIGPFMRFGLERYCAARGLLPHWLDAGAVAVMWTGDGRAPSPTVARLGSLVAVGTVRLENRADIAAGVSSDGALGDLDLLLRRYARYGRGAIRDLIGDFSIVIADGHSGAVLGCRDAFGIHTLYHARFGDILMFASRAECLADGDRYDTDYLAQCAAGAVIEPVRTPYAGVSAVPPASTLLIRGGASDLETFWRPADYEPKAVRDERAAIDEFCELLVRAVGACLSEDGVTWSELSGGLDSSSIVSIVETERARGRFATGIDGTITYVDSVGAGSDERNYSDAVVERFGLRNEQFADYVLLQEPSVPLAPADIPSVRCLLEARDADTIALLRSVGARVLLSGLGADHYLVGNMLFFADWIARGEWRRSVAEMARWASLGRVSLWTLAHRNAVLPLLPARLRNRLARGARTPEWLATLHRRRLNAAAASLVAQGYGGLRGHQYAHATSCATAAIAAGVDHGVIADCLDIRYPFCHRPLVEFALRLPPELIRRPNERKWILRQAMAEYLPEVIRVRRWKGTFDGRVAWSLAREPEGVRRLLAEPILGDLGCIDVSRVQAVMGRATDIDADHARASLLSVLALEYWLQVRSGRWTNRKREGNRGFSITGGRYAHQSESLRVSRAGDEG